MRHLLRIETSIQLVEFLKAHDVWIEYTREDAEREPPWPRTPGPLMRLVVADTSPIFYLLSIGRIDLLPPAWGTLSELS